MEPSSSMPHSQGLSNNPYPSEIEFYFGYKWNFAKVRLQLLSNTTNWFRGLWNLVVQCRIHKSSPIIPILSWISPIPRIDTYSLRLILILSYHLRLYVSIFFDLQLPPLAPHIVCFSNHQGAVFFFLLLSLPSSVLQWHHEWGNFLDRKSVV